MNYSNPAQFAAPLYATEPALNTEVIQVLHPDTTDIVSKGVLKTAWSELKSSSNLDRSLLAVSLLGYGFEQGPGNEWLIAKIGKEAIESVAVHGNIGLTAVTTAGYVATASLVEHTALGVAMSRNLERFPRTVRSMREKSLDSNLLTNSRERGMLRRFGNAFSIGAATVNIEDSLTDPDFVKERKGYRRSLGSAALIASGTAVLGAGVGAGVQQALNTGNQHIADVALNLATNPLIYTGGFVALRTGEYIKNRRARAKIAATEIRETPPLPEHAERFITKPVAWLAVSALAIESVLPSKEKSNTQTSLKDRVKDIAIRSGVRLINRYQETRQKT